MGAWFEEEKGRGGEQKLRRHRLCYTTGCPSQYGFPPPTHTHTPDMCTRDFSRSFFNPIFQSVALGTLVVALLLSSSVVLAKSINRVGRRRIALLFFLTCGRSREVMLFLFLFFFFFLLRQRVRLVTPSLSPYFGIFPLFEIILSRFYSKPCLYAAGL